MENSIISAKVDIGEYTKKVIKLTNKHLKKYGLKKMSVEELDNLCGV